MGVKFCHALLDFSTRSRLWFGWPAGLTVAFLNFVMSLQTRHGSPESFIGMCRMRRFLAALRSFFHSSQLYTLSCHPFSPTRYPSSLTSSSHLFLGLPLNLVVPKFIYRCPRSNVPNFGRVFLMLNYTDITQNTYIQS